MHREGVDIGDAGTTEAIDRLQWVTDRGDRVATPEDPGQHPALSDRGVLVFIEQDDGELLAQHRADLGALVGQPGTEPHLIAEIDEVAHATRFAKLLDEMRELDARECGAARLGGLGVDPRRSVDLCDEGDVEITQRRGLEAVLGQLGIEGSDVLHDGGDCVVDSGHVARGASHDAVRELDRGCLGEQATARLDPDPQAVLGEQATGEGVIGRHGRLTDLVVGHAADAVGEPLDRAPNTRRELAGGLVGEGEPEHLLGTHLASRDQPDNARRHDGGLARARTRDDDEGLERCGDRGELLGAVGDVEQLAELRRAKVGQGVAASVGAHGSTSLPSA